METENQAPRMLDHMPVRVPVDGTFELTVRCNLHCRMCLFRHDDSENRALMEKELTAAQWIELARQAAEMGTLNLLITGGEPMLRPDFREIWEGIYKLGFILQLYTNATLVTPEIMETLKKYPPHRIGVTIYGSSSEVYRKVTGSGKAFLQMCEGVKQLMTLPSAFQFRSTIIKDNYEDIDGIERLVSEEFHYSGIVEEPRSVFPAVRGGTSEACEARLSPEDNVKLIFRRGIDRLRKKVGADKFAINRIAVKATPKKERRPVTEQTQYTLLGCDAGMKSFAVSWDGKLLGCQTLGIFWTDALHNGLKKAWRDFPLAVRLPEGCEKCRGCKIAEYCETCWASRVAETGTLDGWPEYQCSDAHEIAKIIKRGKLI